MTNDVEGLVGHEALPNLNTELGSSSYKRRDALVRHLSRLHGIHEVDQGRAKADSWRYSSGRQAWSCGFCVQLFTTFHERLKHIGIEHFDKHQMIEGWDTNKQMMGLLLQPGVKAAWENIMAVYHPWGLPLLAWNHNDIGDLQLSLEMGPSDGQNAEALAMAVYTTARLDDRPSGPSTVVSQPNLDGGHLQNNLPQTASESIVPSSFLGYGNPIASSKSMSTSYHNYDDNEEEAASGMLAYSNQTLYK